MRIEFDDTKNETNERERGLPFALAAQFDFSTAIIEEDTRKANQREIRDYEQTRTTH